MGQKLSTKSLMAILSDCFPSSFCLLYANIGNNTKLYSHKGDKEMAAIQDLDLVLTFCPKLHCKTTNFKETETLDACIDRLNYKGFY